jgi:NAD(P)H-dependent flavin oxidoreductase YrpB (nitropropane dioxygenase family)
VTAVTDLLGCELPLQLAPMGSVSVSPALPLAVARAGGHAMYPGLGSPPQALAPVLDALDGLPYGVNLLAVMIDQGTLELVGERAPYVDFFLALPDAKLVEQVRGVCGWQVESAEEARAAEAAGCDLVVAKGYESGGRKRIEGAALLPLLDSVLDAVSIPVIASGGIATRRGVAAVLAAGAGAARVGTAFIASEESDAHPLWKQAVIDAGPDDAVVSYAYNAGMPVPGPHRVLRRSLEAAERLQDGEIGVVKLGPAELPVERYAPSPPSAGSTGAVEAMPFYAGQSAGAVTAIRPAAEIVAGLLG